jgi:protein involved in polysaccharide export with SLBB domain
LFTSGIFNTTRLLSAGAVLAAVVLGGCGHVPDDGQGPNGLLDPTAVGNFNKGAGKPLVVPILTELDLAGEAGRTEFASARPPSADDLQINADDYRIGRNDLVTVTIADLVGQGVETQTTKRVSESGNVSLPLVGTVRLLDLTEYEAERAVVDAYARANLIQNANVQVVVTEARARTFSIMGAVAQPGQYAIVQSDFRVLDALVLARGVTAPVGVQKIYIVRNIGTNAPADGQQQPPAGQGEPQPSPTLIQPRSSAEDAAGPGQLARAVYLQTEGQPAQEGVVVIEGQERTVGPAAQGAANAQAGAATQPQQFEGFGELQEPTDKRVIEVDYEALKAGELKYNVVIRPGDLIIVPEPAVGEYYMAGHVLRPGVYSLTGRNITLKQAIASAAMFDALAIPSRTEIVRRLPGDREVFVRVDLEKIFAGQQSDIYLKPNDIVNVGTNAAAPFLAALRGAFRFTYGFGFLYDRNFYDDDDNNN